MNPIMNETVKTWIVSSQKRVFHADTPQERNDERFTALKNEPVSFSLAYRSVKPRMGGGRVPDTPISVLVTSDTLPVSVYRVCATPFAASECEDADPNAIGPCPDILEKRIACPEIIHLEKERILPYYEKDEKQLLNASCAATQSVWITVNEEGKIFPAGDHQIRVRVVDLMKGETISEHCVTIHLIDTLLAENDLLYTDWVHYDCLADDYGLEIWSDDYFKVLAKYIKNATLHEMTTLLTPAFTPALDTPIGMERMNVQLVGVKKDASGYAFDFSLFKRFVIMARENGIRCFEHCHLFSQWGAKCAINVYGEENGKNVRFFGFDTLATDPEYVTFLTQYLTAFARFAKEMGIEKDLLFHISDEPKDSQKESYSQALQIVKDLLGDVCIGDALSDYSFYQTGLVRMPIVRTPKIDDFDGKCPDLMLYYTGGEEEPISNRLLTNAPWKTRILGLHLFRYKAKGFLHWGYNYTYGRMSQGSFNPAIDPCFYKNIPGVTYLVYHGKGQTPLPSLREKQMCEAINDYRALKRLESLIGYDRTLKICEEALGEPIGIFTIPKNGEEMLLLRQRINEEIEKSIS